MDTLCFKRHRMIKNTKDFINEITMRSYHSERLFSPQYPCIAEDIGRNEKGKAKQELQGLQESDYHKQNQLQTML